MGSGTVAACELFRASVELPASKLEVQHRAEWLAGVGRLRLQGISVPFRPFVCPFQLLVGTAFVVVGTAVAAFALVVTGVPGSSEH